MCLMNDGFLDGPRCCAIARSGTGRARQQPYKMGVGAGDQGGELVGHQRPDRSAGGLLGVQADDEPLIVADLPP